MKRLAIIGLGNMGYALVRGLVSSGKALPAMIRAFDIDAAKCRTVVKELGVAAVPAINDVVTPDTDTVILAVKPQVIGPVLESIAHKVHKRLVIISIAAGITTAFILSKLKGPSRVIRAMPNAAAMVSAGATAVCKAGTADDKDLATAVDLFSAVGTAVIVDEKVMNVVTALSGSGPGYLFIIMEALTDGAVLMGLDRPTARALAVQTVMGAATMASSGDITFSELKDRITSPGGTTISGLQVLESGGLRGLIMDAIEAATIRAEETTDKRITEIMEREFQCPSCGASNTVTNPGVLMRVCDYCKTAIYWDKESALRAGEKSADLPDSPRFKVGATGKIKGRSFRVLGRIHYAHEKGTWNEWFIEMENGEIMWLTEDERELFLESPLPLTSPVPPHSELTPGMRIKLNEKEGVIEEIGEAKCLGGEGEIPFQVEIGTVYPYADGSSPDGKSSFGLEYDPASGNVTAFFGRIIDFKEGKPAPEAQKTGVSRVGEVIRCESCGKPYEGPRVETTGMVVCPACGAGLQLDEAEIRVVGENKGKEPKFTLNIGAPVTLENTRYEVMGRLYYVQVEENVQYGSMEYVLYNPDSGYLWLSEEDGHFTLSRTIHTRVPIPPIPVAKMQVRVGNESFKIYESGELTLQWVDGALPWVAAVGEKTQYTHLINPPDYVDQEITGTEVEQFRGRYISRDEMQAAVGESVELPQAKGVYSCQPYVPSVWVAGSWKIGAVFVALNILLMFYAFTSDKNTPVMQESITAEQYSQEYMTKPFTVSRSGTILCLQGQAAVKNSWLAADFALVDAEDRVISEFGGEASYYYGQDSEGSWTEGSSSFDSCFRVDKAGSYRLLVYGQGGSDYSGPSRKEPLKIRLTADKVISWYFTIPLFLSAMVMIIEPFRRRAFEARRWRPVTGDSDDDDDGNGGDDD